MTANRPQTFIVNIRPHPFDVVIGAREFLLQRGQEYLADVAEDRVAVFDENQATDLNVRARDDLPLALRDGDGQNHDALRKFFAVIDDLLADIPHSDAIDHDVTMGDLFVEDASARLIENRAEAILEKEDIIVIEIDPHRQSDLGVGKQILVEALDRNVITGFQKSDHHLEVFFGSMHLEEFLLGDVMNDATRPIKLIEGIGRLDFGVVVRRAGDDEGVQRVQKNLAPLILPGGEQGNFVVELDAIPQHQNDDVLGPEAIQVIDWGIIIPRNQ